MEIATKRVMGRMLCWLMQAYRVEKQNCVWASCNYRWAGWKRFLFRTNIHHTLKKNPLRSDDLKEFIECYRSSNRHKRKETFNADKNPEGRWRKFTYDEITNRDKTSLDISWVKDKALADLDNLPDPDELAEEIVENLEAGLESFKAVVRELGK